MSGQMDVSESSNSKCVVSENPGIDAARRECQVQRKSKIADLRGHDVTDKFLDRHHLWLTTGFFSQHFTSNNTFNQKNIGMGAELQLTKHNTLTSGWYYNSIRQNSFYAADELRWQIKDFPIKVGAGLGIVSGYRTGIPIIPMALPMVSLEANREKHPILSHLGADFVVIPPIGNKETGTPAVAAIRMKYAWGGK